MVSLKNLQLIKRNKAWLLGGQSLKSKISYYPSLVISYLKYFLAKSAVIKYLGHKFFYDNKITPLGLMFYPEEVGLIIKNIDQPLKKVLDIGANIGQFAITLAHLSPESQIDSFEPHPETFKLLKNNSKDWKNIKPFNYGVGKAGKQKLHFLPERSVNASLLPNNAKYRIPNKKSEVITIDVIDNIEKITANSKYDLIKIDVEGYEYQALKYLHNLQTKYLYIEVTGQGRDKDYKHSDLFEIIEDRFGKFDILYVTRDSKSKFETLLKFYNS